MKSKSLKNLLILSVLIILISIAAFNVWQGINENTMKSVETVAKIEKVEAAVANTTEVQKRLKNMHTAKTIERSNNK